MGRTGSRTIFVGNLPGDIREREVEDIFYKYGHIVDIDLKIPPKPPSFAFVEFEDSRDAEDAIDGRDGYDFYGHRLRVELAHGGRGRPSPVDRYSNHNSGSFRGSISRRSDFRVLVSGLPSNASWQDLKDHMRRAGDVCFSQVYREGRGTVGVVDYTNYDDMKYAIRKLDHSEFRNAFGRAHVRVKEYGSRSPSPRSLSPRSRSRSPRSRSPISSDSLKRSPSGSSKNPSPPRRGKQLSSVRSRSRSVSSRSRGSPKNQSPPRRGKQLSSFRSRSRSRSRSVSSRSGSKASTPSGSRSRSIPPSTSPLWGKRMSLLPKEESPRKNRSLSASP